MIKFRFFLDFAKEETWLTEMAHKGYELDNICMGYHFRQGKPEDTQIRIDHRVFRSQAEFVNYCTLFADCGWQHIAGTQISGVQYFKRLSPTVGEDIFSDEFSRAERFKRVSLVWLVCAGLMLFSIIQMAFTGSINLNAIINPKLFYLTPGLWEKSGEVFQKAFWFETPFALFRAAMLYFFPVALIVYLIFAVKSYRLYKKGKSNASEFNITK
jgi:hypothetical protein